MTPHEQALVHLRLMVSTCQMCGLGETRTNTVFSRGDGSSGLVVVGEQLGLGRRVDVHAMTAEASLVHCLLKRDTATPALL